MKTTVKYLVEIQISPMFPALKDGTRIIAYEEVVCLKIINTGSNGIGPINMRIKAFDQFKTRLQYEPNFRKELEAKGFYNPDWKKCRTGDFIEI